MAYDLSRCPPSFELGDTLKSVCRFLTRGEGGALKWPCQVDCIHASSYDGTSASSLEVVDAGP
jgi:hypothetical protein